MKLTKLETAEEQLELAQNCYMMGYRVAAMCAKAGRPTNGIALRETRAEHRPLLKHLVDLTEEDTASLADELFRTNFTEGYAHWIRMQTAALTDLDEGDQMAVFLDPLSDTYGYQLNLSEDYGYYPDTPVTGFESADEAERQARERYEQEFKHRERTT